MDLQPPSSPQTLHTIGPTSDLSSPLQYTGAPSSPKSGFFRTSPNSTPNQSPGSTRGDGDDDEMLIQEEGFVLINFFVILTPR